MRIPFVGWKQYEKLRLAHEKKETELRCCRAEYSFVQERRAEAEARVAVLKADNRLLAERAAKAEEQAQRSAAETRLALETARQTIHDALDLSREASRALFTGLSAPPGDGAPPTSVAEADRVAAQRIRQQAQRVEVTG